MNVTASTQLDAMATSATNAVQFSMLRKAMDQNASSVVQLLQGLPQKDGAGSVVDVQA